ASNPDFAAAAMALAQAMFRRGATPAEVEAALPAGRPSVLLLAASACHEAGHFEEAAAWFGRVLAAQPANGAARVGLVEALLATRRFDVAARVARDRDGSPVEAQLAVAECFVRALGADPAALAEALGRA